MKLETLLRALPVVGPVAAAAPEFRALWDEAAALIANKDDQATAKDALHDLIADNEAGYARLDAKLAAAAQR